MANTHTLFPTAQQADANPELIYSDHLPVLFEANISETDKLRIISWNILGYNAPSGFSHARNGWESEEQGRARYDRILKALQLFVANHSPDVITLQEASTELFTEIEAALPDYQFYDTGRGPAMLIRKSLHDNIESVTANERRIIFNNVDMWAKQTAVFNIHGQRVVVNNVHTAFYETPEHHEAYYKSILEDQQENSVNIIVGDTNSRIAPVDASVKQNITTGAVPLCLNLPEDNQQYTDFPDAAFIKCPDQNIQQIERKVLDYRNGELYQPEAGDLDTAEPKADILRPLLCLTDYSDAQFQIEGKNVFEYEQYLKLNVNELDGLVVRTASKDNNERGFAFCFGNARQPLFIALCQRLAESDLSHDNKYLQIKKYDNYLKAVQGGIICVHKEKLSEFLAILNPLVNSVRFSRQIAAVDASIIRLHKTRFNLFKRSAINKIERLQTLKAKLSNSDSRQTLVDIINEWEAENVQVGGVNKSTNVIISERRNRFIGTIFYRESKAPESDLRIMINNMKGME